MNGVERNKIWEIFSCKEESEPYFTDTHKRITSKSIDSTPFKPVVSEFLASEGFKPEYPGGHPFAVCLSHDMDFIYQRNAPSYTGGFKNITGLAVTELKQRFGSKKIQKNFLNPDWHPHKIFEKHRKYGIRSSYYFLSLQEGDQDFTYSPADIQDVFDTIKTSNNEIGLHGGHVAYNNSKKIEEEKNRLEKAIGQPVSGYRNHFMKFDTFQTWNYLSENGFLYDTTFGFSDCIGYRNGMCYPFHPFNFEKSDFHPVLELPLIIMDRTLFDYMRLDFEQAFAEVKKMTLKIKQLNGVLTLLWHNTQMTGEMGAFYEKVLEMLHSEGALFMTGEEISRYWKEKTYDQQVNNMLKLTQQH